MDALDVSEEDFARRMASYQNDEEDELSTNATVDIDPLLQEDARYDPTTLVWPLLHWEMARHHLVTGKRLAHGSRQYRPCDHTGTRHTRMVQRQYLFGTSGSGIGSLAVHPSQRFFAVAERR
jgi:hypothetical protein